MGLQVWYTGQVDIILAGRLSLKKDLSLRTQKSPEQREKKNHCRQSLLFRNKFLLQREFAGHGLASVLEQKYLVFCAPTCFCVAKGEVYDGRGEGCGWGPL